MPFQIVAFTKASRIEWVMYAPTHLWSNRAHLNCHIRLKTPLTRILQLVLLTAVVSAAVYPAQRADACSPPPGGFPKFTVADRTEAAEIVLEGTVASLSDEDSLGDFHSATVDVQKYFKGQGPATVDISGFGNPGLCLSRVGTGDRLIFYARGDPSNGLSAHYLSVFFGAVDPADAKTIAEVIAAVGQAQITPVDGPSEALLPTTGDSDVVGLVRFALGVGILAVFMGVMMVLVRWRKGVA